MASTAALVEFDPDTSEELVFSIQDIADCFYQFAIPDELAAMFGLRPVPAVDLGILEIDGTPVAPDCVIVPCFCVLPMGFSYALQWTQESHRHLLMQGGLGGVERECLDRRPPPAPLGGDLGRVVYVDNEAFIATKEHTASKCRRAAAACLEGHGLPPSRSGG